MACIAASEKFMSRIRRLLLASAGALLAASPVQAGGPNVAVCMTLANAYNNCIVQQNYAAGRGGPPRGYPGGYGRGYDDRGGWDADDDAYWRAQRRAARANRAQAACMGWLAQMKAANCY